MQKYDTETKAAIVAELSQKGFRQVALRNGISETTLRTWAQQAGIKPPDGRRRNTGAPASAKGAAKPAPDSPATDNGPRLTIKNFSGWLRECVREELRPMVREELRAMLNQLGAGKP